MTEYFIATNCEDGVKEHVFEKGIAPVPGAGFVPLAGDKPGAVKRLLSDTWKYNKIPADRIKTAYIFTVEIPESMNLKEVKNTRPDLKDFHFVSYEGTLPPEYITECEIANFYNANPDPGAPIYTANVLYFGVPEDEIKRIEEGGFIFSEIPREEMNEKITDPPRGAVLTTTSEEAATLYESFYNKPTALAVFGVVFPSFVSLHSERKVATPDGETIRVFLFEGKIAPEYLTGYSVYTKNKEADQ